MPAWVTPPVTAQTRLNSMSRGAVLGPAVCIVCHAALTLSHCPRSCGPRGCPAAWLLPISALFWFQGSLWECEARHPRPPPNLCPPGGGPPVAWGGKNWGPSHSGQREMSIAQHMPAQGKGELTAHGPAVGPSAFSGSHPPPSTKGKRGLSGPHRADPVPRDRGSWQPGPPDLPFPPVDGRGSRPSSEGLQTPTTLGHGWDLPFKHKP